MEQTTLRDDLLYLLGDEELVDEICVILGETDGEITVEEAMTQAFEREAKS
jgi:hypothetical protein